MATPGGFEPPTDCLEGSCSIQLSYGVVLKFLESKGDIAKFFGFWKALS